MAKRFRSILIVPNRPGTPVYWTSEVQTTVTTFDMGSIRHHEIRARDVWLTWEMLWYSLLVPSLLTFTLFMCTSGLLNVTRILESEEAFQERMRSVPEEQKDAAAWEREEALTRAKAHLLLSGIVWISLAPLTLLAIYPIVRSSVMRSIAIKSRGVPKTTPLRIVWENHWEKFRKKLL